MSVTLKLLVMSACIMLASLAVPLGISNIAWTREAGFSFFLQVALPRIGIVLAGILGGYAGTTRLLVSKEDELPRVAIPLSLLAIAMLIGGIYIGEHAYVCLYSLACPAMIGLGVGRISHTALMQKSSVVTGLIVLLAIISIALIMVGAGSDDWIMTIDFGTGLRVLFAALIGGLLKLR